VFELRCTRRHDRSVRVLLDITTVSQVQTTFACPMLCEIGYDKYLRGEISYTIGGVQLPVKTETSDLGVIVDSKLRFDKHIASIVNKAHGRAALIKRCFRSKDFILLFRAFTVFIRPMLEYCSSVWNLPPIIIVM